MSSSTVVPTLELRELSVRLATFVVLRGVSLAVPPGRIVGLVGRNGAGKTTMLKSVVGLVRVAGGEIRLDGRDLRAVPPHRRPALGVGYLPEDRRLIPALTVDENLSLPLWAQRRLDAARLSLAYELMPELRPLTQRRAGALSGGQQKMVALARALMTGTRLLLLDEPLEGLSPMLARRLAEVIRGLQGIAVLVTESDANRMRMLTDACYTIERGEIVREDERATRGAREGAP